MIKDEIGFTAGRILDILETKSDITLREIGELTHLKDSTLLLALGWLAREGKIVLYINEDKRLRIKTLEIKFEFYF